MKPALTRRLAPGTHLETWLVFYGDVQVGTIGRRAGVPNNVDQWEWSCGFYPRSHHGHHFDDTAENFEQARTAFDACWKRYLPDCTEADFREYRRQRDFTAWKYAMHDAGRPLPTQITSGRSRCFCGTPIDNASLDRHIEQHHTMETT